MADTFCALCGVSFNIIADTYNDSFNSDYDFEWLKLYRVGMKRICPLREALLTAEKSNGILSPAALHGIYRKI